MRGGWTTAAAIALLALPHGANRDLPVPGDDSALFHGPVIVGALSDSADPRVRVECLREASAALGAAESALLSDPALTAFVDAASRTRETLQAQAAGFLAEGCGLIDRELAGLALGAPETAWERLNSNAYWRELRNAFAGMGCVISSRSLPMLDRAVYPMRFCASDPPEGTRLIGDGKERGFFLVPGGHLFVPGAAFYETLLAGARPDDAHWTRPGEVLDASLAALAAEDTASALAGLHRVLDDPYLCETGRGDACVALFQIHAAHGDMDRAGEALRMAASAGVSIPELYAALAGGRPCASEGRWSERPSLATDSGAETAALYWVPGLMSGETGDFAASPPGR